MLKIKVTKLKILLSLGIIVYIWSLPILSKIGFASKNESSISGYIATPPATGAMAVLSYLPLTLMSEYVENTCEEKKRYMDFSLTMFKFFYGLFLICTFHYCPYYIHMSIVFLFCFSYSIHAFFTILFLQPNIITSVILLIGTLCFSMIPIVCNSKYMFFVESIGLTCIFMFTPVDLYLLDEPDDENFLNTYFKL